MNKISHRISSSRSSVWRGDLVRSQLALPDLPPLDATDFDFASTLGFDWHPPINETTSGREVITRKRDRFPSEEKQADFADADIGQGHAPKLAHYWIPTLFRSTPWPSPREDLDHGEDGAEIPKPKREHFSDGKLNSDKPLPFKPLATGSQLRTRLEPLLSRKSATRRVDVHQLVKQFVNGKSIRKIPCVVRKRPPHELVLLSDRSERCIPFFRDQRFVGELLNRLLGNDRCDHWVTRSATLFERSTNAFRIPSINNPSFLCDAWIESLSRSSSVLILGDLGVLERNQRAVDSNRWLRTLRRMKDNGINTYALVPFSTERLPKSLADAVIAISWQGNAVHEDSDAVRAQLVHELFVRLYPAFQVEPELLREVRLNLPSAMDGSIESEFWQHPWLSNLHESCALCDDRNVKARLENEFERLDEGTRSFVLETQRDFRMRTCFDWLWLLEFLNLTPRSQKLLQEYSRDRLAMAKQILAYAGNASAETTPDEDEDRVIWISKRFSEAALWDQDKQVGSSVRVLHRIHQNDLLHASTRAREIPSDGKHRQLGLTWGEDGIQGERLWTDEGERLAPDRKVILPATSKLLELTVCTADSLLPTSRSEEAFWQSGRRPTWVSEYGTDQYGAWCEFQVPRHDGNGMVTQRMRWIPPGEFMMGSPESERELYLDEGPQHSVKLTAGYWLADTPVTQELWMAISNGRNPSAFEGESLPVGNVSWDECQAWLGKLGKQHESLQASFPSEAQWEYACRAGYNTAYYFGDDPKELPKYAWFDLNSDGRTHPVKQLEPNVWGLHDMHGNVWEWCNDWRGYYPSTLQTDPIGPTKGSERVCRGGSFDSHAWYVRSAVQIAYPPSYFRAHLGFRLLSSAQGAEPRLGATKPAAVPGGERATEVRARVKTAQTAVTDSFWKSGVPPRWVSRFGRDNQGLWCEFDIPRHDGKGDVIQRMRWIIPGEFMIGSPWISDAFYDETPHPVLLTQGYWLADTPVTHSLWMAVSGGKNPSRFVGEENPVENVSWEDVVTWIDRLKEETFGDGFRLPTEAQWEYACRAGSRSDFCFGNDERELQDYGWFVKNSKGSTQGVKLLKPNVWNLYDMHGNVWEWCSDRMGKYKKSLQMDPTGPKMGSLRVIRGGSWSSPARIVRSAWRHASPPSLRYDFLGFRLLSSAFGAEPSKGAITPLAEPGVERVRIGSADPAFEFLRSIDLDRETPDTIAGEFDQIDFGSLRSIRVVSDRAGYQFDRITRPSWAVDFGSDAYGLYAAFEITPRDTSRKKKLNSVRQKLRWIPPGRFLMGSCDGEVGRQNGELQHSVIITNGYWMFDTPCTQALWECAMGENPSHFVESERPVEQVSWPDVDGFIRRLRVSLPEELSFRLPTEAEWEYACRSGTTTATYAGDLAILGDANAPILDKIAWYGGNSGHEYDLQTHRKVTWLDDRQYPGNTGGTRKVGSKAANGWGLYDMLGNVWEWCWDWKADYEASEQMDPIGPAQGSGRVVKGGSWYNPARYVRSACRRAIPQGSQHVNLGFRLLSSEFEPG